jgi:hypothetical protein
MMQIPSQNSLPNLAEIWITYLPHIHGISSAVSMSSDEIIYQSFFAYFSTFWKNKS